MEDNVYAIFHTEKEQVFYKQILSEQESIELNNKLIKSKEDWKDGAMVIASGKRPYIDLDIKRDLPEILERLKIVLKDYFPDMIVSNDTRFYNHQFGGVRPHVDVSRDGISKYTILLYLSSDFEGGRLSIKLKRSEEEKQEEPTKHHKIFTFTPKLGYAVIFRKSLLHWADEVVEGQKNFLCVNLYSQF